MPDLRAEPDAAHTRPGVRVKVTLPPLDEKEIVCEGATGPAEVLCTRCRRFTLKVTETAFVRFVGPAGHAEIAGGTEEWECWTCWRRQR